MASILQVVELLGTVAFALSGIIEARRKEMDLVGIYAVAFITAFGGGTLRDILLNRRPLYWVQHQEYALLVLALCLASLIVPQQWRGFISPRSINIPDALGLGLFSTVGVSYALELGLPVFAASLMGVITGVFGGVIRDIIINEIPSVFLRRTQLYATCAFGGSWVYILLQMAGVDGLSSLLAGGLVTFVFRLLALRFDWHLP